MLLFAGLRVRLLVIVTVASPALLHNLLHLLLVLSPVLAKQLRSLVVCRAVGIGVMKQTLCDGQQFNYYKPLFHIELAPAR